MAGEYYDRRVVTHLDGTPIFATVADVQSETEVAALIEAAWKCQVHRFGLLSPIDWYSTRAGRLVGVLELKTRSHSTAAFKTVFLNVRKWLCLSSAEVGLGVPALFVVRFTDAVRWVRIVDVDARLHRIGGCARAVKADSDVEPVIEVNVDQMRSVVSAPTGEATTKQQAVAV